MSSIGFGTDRLADLQYISLQRCLGVVRTVLDVVVARDFLPFPERPDLSEDVPSGNSAAFLGAAV